jgi:DNA-binding response OmpR family regulator
LTLPQHIAVVDDEVDITRLLAGYLESQGFRLRSGMPATRCST